MKKMYRETINLIEEKRKQVNNRLQELLNQNKISIDSYNELIKLNQKLSQDLAIIFIESEKLMKNGIIEDISDILKLERKPKTIEQIFMKMKEIIEGPLGSHNTYIQLKAKNIALDLLKKYGFPEDMHINEIYSIFIPSLYIGASQYVRASLFVTHMNMIARAIYEWVQNEMIYISDPPDDWFKQPLHTLMVGGGDCDDLAMLLCSLWRSIGFKTYLGFLPGHVFPGIILARLSSKPIKKESLPKEIKEKIEKERGKKEEEYFKIDEVKFPADPQFKYRIKVGNIEFYINAFDLIFEEDFKKKMFSLKKELEKMPEETKKKKEKEIKQIINKFNEYISAEIFEIEPIEPIKLLRKRNNL